jgi:hypothetical protein
VEIISVRGKDNNLRIVRKCDVLMALERVRLVDSPGGGLVALARAPFSLEASRAFQ